MTYKDINKQNWHDFYLNDIKIDYENLVVSLIDASDNLIKIMCKGFIGIHYLGQWDENVVKDINIGNESDILEQTLQIIKVNNGTSYKGGGLRNLNHQWLELQIQLIDGVEIKIPCMEVKIIT